VFGQHAVAAPPGSDWYAWPAASKTEPESKPMPPKAKSVSQTEIQPAPVKAPPQIAQAAPMAQGAKPVMPIPEYKKYAVGVQGRKWQDWGIAVKQLPNLSPAEEKSYMEVFAAEGGTEPDPESTAVGGILQSTLDGLFKGGKSVKGVVPGKSTGQLSPQDRAKIYRSYVDEALNLTGGSHALSRIGDTEAAAALVDTLFKHGRTGGGSIIEKAINDVVPKRVKVDGPVGNQAFSAYKELVADPNQRRQLLDAIAKRRIETTKNDKHQQGLIDRYNHFRFQKSP